MNFLFYHALLICLQIISNIRFTSAYSQIWGRVHPLAVAIYEIDLELSRDMLTDVLDNDEDAFVDVLFPSLGTKNNYIITMMLVLDGRKERGKLVSNLVNDEAVAEAYILEGGIGLNYTRVRFFMLNTEMNFNFIIYGVHPKAFDM